MKSIPAVGLATVIEHRGINTRLVSGCYYIWSELGRVVANIDNFIQSDLPTNFDLEPIRQFGDAVRNYIELFRDHLGKVVKTRPCDNEVEKIVVIAKRLFQLAKLDRWLGWKQEESEITNMIREGAVPFLKKDQLNRELANSGGRKCLILNIPQLNEETNKILSLMRDNKDPFTNMSLQITVGDPWYMNFEKRKFVLDKIRELTKHVENNKHLKDQVKFFVTTSESSKDFNCYYSIFETGEKKHLSGLPRTPTDLKFYISKTQSVYIKWDHEDLAYPYNFVVEHRSKVNFEKKWIREMTGESNIRFEAGPELEVRVAMDTLIGRSKFSDIFVVPAVAIQLPPNVKSITDSTAEFEWIPPSVNDQFSYRVKCWSTRWSKSLVPTVQELVVDNKIDCLVTNLFPETTYNVNIVAETKDEQQSILPSKILQFTTSKAKKIRYAETIMISCKKIDIWNNLDIYAVPVTKTTQPDSRVDRFVFGIPGGRKQHKTIILLGAAGSGKSTLINCLINYIFNVDWADPFRFQLIDGHLTKDEAHQIDTKTSKISIYDIHHAEGFNIPFSLTIVDTPGYEVENYKDNDEKIAQTIRQLIEDRNGIKELDMICYVLKCTPPFLMYKEYLNFDSVLSMFGKDVKDNINLIATCNGRVPVEADPFKYCLSNKKICDKPLNRHSIHCFDMFLSNGKQDTNNCSFWNVARINCQQFFEDLSRKRPRLLSSTKQLLEKKTSLKEMVDSLSKLINIGFIRKDAIKRGNALVSDYLMQIEAYKKEVAANSSAKVDLLPGWSAKNCSLCSVTCQISNTRSYDSQVTTPFCSVCPGKCDLAVHSNVPYRIVSVKQEANFKLEAEIQKLQNAKNIVGVLQREVEDNEKDVLQRIDTFWGCITWLEDVSLHPKSFISVDFIDSIIKNLENRMGFEEKVQKFRTLRQYSPFLLP